MSHSHKNNPELIAAVLDELEAELRALECWHGTEGRPHDKAFASTMPFCLDTMEFEQWLEYVLVERLRLLIEQEQPLPEKLLIAPAAQEYWRGQWGRYRRLIGVLRKLDSLFA